MRSNKEKKDVNVRMRTEDGSARSLAHERLLLDLKDVVRRFQGSVHGAKRHDVERGLDFGRRPNVPSKAKPISVFSLIEVIHRSDIPTEQCVSEGLSWTGRDETCEVGQEGRDWHLGACVAQSQRCVPPLHIHFPSEVAILADNRCESPIHDLNGYSQSIGQAPMTQKEVRIDFEDVTLFTLLLEWSM